MKSAHADMDITKPISTRWWKCCRRPWRPRALRLRSKTACWRCWPHAPRHHHRALTMQSIVATLLITGCAYSISASAGNVQIQVLGRDGKPFPGRGGAVPQRSHCGHSAQPAASQPTIEQERMRFVPALTVVAPAPRCVLPTRTAGTTMCVARRWPCRHGRGRGNEGFEMRLAGKQDGQAAQAAETTVRDCTGQSGLFAGHLAHFGRTYPRAHA